MSNDGLISETWFEIDRGRIVVNRVWDLKHPRSPLQQQFLGIARIDDMFNQQVILEPEEARVFLDSKVFCKGCWNAPV